MATCIFHVDVSNEAGDFQAVATEPGLAMLDRPGANYEILRRWFGDVIADPEWHGENLVGFYVQDTERGRLERVECQPVTRRDLEGPLKADLEELETRIKKVKPESSEERLLHHIVRPTFGNLTKRFRLLLLQVPPKERAVAAGLVLGLSTNRLAAGARDPLYELRMHAAFRPPQQARQGPVSRVLDDRHKKEAVGRGG